MTIKILLHVIMIATIIVTILVPIAFAVVFQALRKSVIKTTDNDKQHRRINKHYVIAIITVCSAILLCGGGVIYACNFLNNALAHGMYDNQITVSEAYESIQHSPKEDKLPKDLNDTVVIYYRFGCKECETLFDTLQNEAAKFETKTGEKIYWVSTRSEQGKALRKTCHTDNLTVPSIMYIHTIENENAKFYLEPIYYRDPDGTHFYPAAWDKIIEIRDQYTNGVKFAS